MKKASSQQPDDELRPEYDFSKMSGAVRGKYADRYRDGTNLALLEPDVAKAFPDDASVNAALRLIMEAAARLPKRKRRSPPKSA